MRPPWDAAQVDEVASETACAHRYRLLGTRLKNGEVGLERHLTLVPLYFFRCRDCGRIAKMTFARAAEQGWIDVHGPY
jgi:hypothetical protein